ncbi:MAG TPA: P-loop NTPase [Paludibacteraceae bacterium]|nr:MAG: Ferredoxin-2 [Bacteroidetes bacterium ADurb.Bin057]HOG36391.1 P-loop NTPase [Paludibacteraceae bacterium]HOO24034.1 P-loop NTPase [Paludibacteraceae bacterium]HOS37209.1 P-loop NTPase [Paludibacteraceae bacterium]HPD27547.1 P-loop NTPase [Paludibacteraceae bacterium]
MEIAVISGKGGTGKSSISVAFATLQKEVVLADCDVDAANLYLLFNPVCEEEQIVISGQKAVINQDKCIACGECIDYCRFDAIIKKDDKVSIVETFCDGCLLCSRICPQDAIDIIDEDKSRIYAGSFKNGKMVYGRLAPGEENTGKIVSKVREKAKQIAKEFGIKTIIIDGPPGIGCSAISAIIGVDSVVVVTEPTLSGLHDLKRTLEITTSSNLQTSVIINKCDINPEMSSKIEAYCNQKHIEVIGKLPFEPLVVEAMVKCQSITDFAPDAEISKLIGNIYSKIRATT